MRTELAEMNDDDGNDFSLEKLSHKNLDVFLNEKEFVGAGLSIDPHPHGGAKDSFLYSDHMFRRGDEGATVTHKHFHYFNRIPGNFT